jgi:hypothetical protein
VYFTGSRFTVKSFDPLSWHILSVGPAETCKSAFIIL